MFEYVPRPGTKFPHIESVRIVLGACSIELGGNYVRNLHAASFSSKDKK